MAAGDSVLAIATTGKSLHLAGASARVISVKADGGLSFFAGTTATKQTVTGAKGSNAALGSLLTALAAYGLITDSTTA
jgi:hypothetical protein